MAAQTNKEGVKDDEKRKEELASRRAAGGVNQG